MAYRSVEESPAPGSLPPLAAAVAQPGFAGSQQIRNGPWATHQAAAK
jgi:hypothetical protein